MSKKLELAMRIRTDLNQARGDLKALGGDVEDLGDKSEKTSRDMERIGSTLGTGHNLWRRSCNPRAIPASNVYEDRAGSIPQGARDSARHERCNGSRPKGVCDPAG